MNNANEKIIKCSLCGALPKLVENSIQYGRTRFIIIGESPAKDGWIKSKRAFYNTSGKLQGTGRILEKLLNNIGLSISDIYFTECCKCIIEEFDLVWWDGVQGLWMDFTERERHKRTCAWKGSVHLTNPYHFQQSAPSHPIPLC